jgi:hypothetical protein
MRIPLIVITRRTFSRMLLLGTVGVSLPQSGCNVEADLIDFIPYITEALGAITKILGSLMPPPAALIITGIEASLSLLSAALAEYKSDPNPTDKATTLAKIETFLTDIGDNFQAFLDALGAAGPIASVVLGIIQVVLSTISWFAGEFSSAAPATAAARPAILALARGRQLRATNQYLYITPTKRSIKEFKRDFNAVVYTNGHAEAWMY